MNKRLTVLIAILFIAVAVLGGLYISGNLKAGKNEPDETAASAQDESETAKVTDEETQAQLTSESAYDTEEGAERLEFVNMPEEYWFSSGVGGWSTLLTIKADGSFVCSFSDRDYKTIYYSVAEGSFSAPMNNDNGTCRIKIEEMKVTNDKSKFAYYDEEAEYIETGCPYGFENTDVFIVYKPGTPLSLIPEDSRFWLHLDEDVYELPEGCYALYNPSEGYIFIGYPEAE